MSFPLGYHITFGTYGTRLQGSSKPHVDHRTTEFGAPLSPTNPVREKFIRERMRFELVRLTLEQRKLVEDATCELCLKYEWKLHAIAAQSDHVHVVVTAPREGDALRDAIKAYASRALNASFGKRTWWAEKGSDRWLWDEDYMGRATQYVLNQRDF